jgi:hypothetical protein
MPFNFEKKEKEEKKDAGMMAKEAHEKGLNERKDKFNFGKKEEEKKEDK